MTETLDVHSQRAQILARPGVPKLDQHVFTPTRHEPFARVPIHTSHIPSVTAQDLFFLPTPKVPDLDPSIVPAGDKLFVVRAERDRPDRLSMRGQGFQVIDGRRVIFEYPPLVAGEEEEAGMRIGERTDGVVVRLFEGFKVEGGPVPDGELAHLIACQTPAAVGCPLSVSRWSDEKNRESKIQR